MDGLGGWNVLCMRDRGLERGSVCLAGSTVLLYEFFFLLDSWLCVGCGTWNEGCMFFMITITKIMRVDRMAPNFLSSVGFGGMTWSVVEM